jgi:hypothetical protein
MVYIWQMPDDYPEKLIGVYDKSRSPDRFLLKAGKPVDIDETYLRFNAKGAVLREVDDLATSAMVPLVSRRVAEVLSRLASDQVQLVTARIETLDEDILDYKFVVATRQVKAIDHEASEYSYVPGTTAITPRSGSIRGQLLTLDIRGRRRNEDTPVLR